MQALIDFFHSSIDPGSWAVAFAVVCIWTVISTANNIIFWAGEDLFPRPHILIDAVVYYAMLYVAGFNWWGFGFVVAYLLFRLAFGIFRLANDDPPMIGLQEYFIERIQKRQEYSKKIKELTELYNQKVYESWI